MSARRRARFPVTSWTSGDAARWSFYACAFCALLVLRSSARRGVETASSKYTHTRDFEHKSRTPETVVWSTDLHAGPIGCQVSMFATLNIDVEAEVDVPNCKYFQNGRGENLCASGRGLRNDQNRGFSLDPHPNNTRRRLYTHFSANGDFSRADVVFCSHPAANCEIYLPFDKSILIYNTQRLEFGRDDEFIWWREPIIGADRRERWEHWVHKSKAI